MADLLALSSHIIDNNDTDIHPNRVINELSEIRDDLAIVESFSHSVVLDTGEGLVAFDTSTGSNGRAVVEQIAAWRSSPVTHLMYTHGHADHVGGSREFAAVWNNPVVVGHENVAARFDRYAYTNDWNVEINARQFGGVNPANNLALSPDELDDDDAVATTQPRRWNSYIPKGTLRPTIEVDRHHSMTIGGTTIEAHHAIGETDDHLWFWLPASRTIMAGDFLIWMFPNAGNPQKVQRYPREWAAALRTMAAMEPELFVPAHGLPITGADRIARVLDDVASALEHLVDTVVAMMNGGATLDTIIHEVDLPADTLAKPYLRPLYDEPEFVVRNIWRLYGGWWDGAASRLKPSPDAQLAACIAEMAGGIGPIVARARAAAEADDMRLACHLADIAAWAAPSDASVHTMRAEIYMARRRTEPSLMAKGIFAAAARESSAAAGNS